MVYGGSALLSGVSAIAQVTPHFAGAVDVVVVEQPDGSYKSTPFYGELPQVPARCKMKRLCKLVCHRLSPAPPPPSPRCAVRFGKYTHLRSRDRVVSIHVNGAWFVVHLLCCPSSSLALQLVQHTHNTLELRYAT